MTVNVSCVCMCYLCYSTCMTVCVCMSVTVIDLTVLLLYVVDAVNGELFVYMSIGSNSHIDQNSAA